MTEIELYKQIVQKQDEYVSMLEYGLRRYDLNNQSFITKRDELADLRQQLGKCDEDKYCTCGNPSKQGNVHFEGDEELIYICDDCGKRAKE